MNETIEAGARARGITVADLRVEAAEFARLRASTPRPDGPRLPRPEDVIAAERDRLRKLNTEKHPGLPVPAGATFLRERRPTVSKTMQATPAAGIEAQLEAEYRRGGLSAEAAGIAALPTMALRDRVRGRGT